MRLYAEIRKFDRAQRMVYGYASSETVDSHGERVTKQALEAALPSYLKFGNIREMHQPSAVGVARQAEVDDKGLYIGAHIVDDVAWRKVIGGVYKGFSIGGRVGARSPDDPNVITALQLSEISLVDRPANPDAVFDLWKAGETYANADAPTPTDIAGEVKRLMAAVAQLESGLAELVERVAALEGTTMQPKAALMAVPKEADDLRKDDHVEREPKTSLDAIKLALKMPQTIFRTG